MTDTERLDFIGKLCGSEIACALWWRLPPNHPLRMDDAIAMPLRELIDVVKEAYQ